MLPKVDKVRQICVATGKLHNFERTVGLRQAFPQKGLKDIHWQNCLWPHRNCFRLCPSWRCMRHECHVLRWSALSIGNSHGIFQRPGGELCALRAAGRLTRWSCLATGEGQQALRGGGSRHRARRLSSRTSRRLWLEQSMRPGECIPFSGSALRTGLEGALYDTLGMAGMGARDTDHTSASARQRCGMGTPKTSRVPHPGRRWRWGRCGGAVECSLVETVAPLLTFLLADGQRLVPGPFAALVRVPGPDLLCQEPQGVAQTTHLGLFGELSFYGFHKSF